MASGQIPEFFGMLPRPFGILPGHSGMLPEPFGHLPEESGQMSKVSGHLPQFSGTHYFNRKGTVVTVPLMIWYKS